MVASKPEPNDAALFQEDFKEIPLDESADKTIRKKENTRKTQLAFPDMLDGLVQQAKMEEITPLSESIQSDQNSGRGAALDAPVNASNSSETATILDPHRLMQDQGTPKSEPEDEDEQLDEDGEKIEKDESQNTSENTNQTKSKPEYPDDAHMDALPSENLPPMRVLEAALFLANKPMSHKQLQDFLAVPKDRLDALLAELSAMVPKESSYELSVNEHGAALQLKPQYLHRVAKLSKEVELSKKSMRILALVAKKKELLQSDLKHFFKGEIYAYVTELKMAGYLESKKHGNTRKLKPTTKFFESFQVKEV